MMVTVMFNGAVVAVVSATRIWLLLLLESIAQVIRSPWC